MSKTSLAFVRTEDAPVLPPPPAEIGVWGWLWRNMFSSMSNYSTPGAAAQSLLMIFATVFVGWFGISQMIGLLNFAIIDAVWDGSAGEKRLACATVAQGGALPEDWYGACHPYISANWEFLIYGFFPSEEIWRVNIFFLVGSLGIGWLTMDAIPRRRAVGLALIALAVAYGLLVVDLYDETFGARVGVQILAGLGVIYVLGPPEPPKKLVGVLMLTAYPVMSFVLLTGGGLEVSPGFFGGWGVAAVLAFAIGLGGGRGMLGPIGEALGGIANTAGALIVAMLVVSFIGVIDFGLETVETDRWGGLLVTLIVAVAGIVFSLPLGILLALGRRSSLPAVRILSIAFIEFWRGVPLITVLFMSSVMLPLFLPEDLDFNKLLRALIGVMLFSAAYQAEVVRGGLQAIPKGQYEGAMALGLPYWRMMRFIVLPQALTLVIPGIVNTFIGLFKDTTLVLIISIFDLLGAMQTTLSDASWATPVQAATGYVVVAAMFWIFCFGMSRYSMFMERELRRGRTR